MSLYFPDFKYLGIFPWTPVVTTIATDVGPGTSYPVAVPLQDLWAIYWRSMRFEGEGQMVYGSDLYAVSGNGPVRATVPNNPGPGETPSPLPLMNGVGYFMLIDESGDPFGATLEFTWGADSRIYNGEHYPRMDAKVAAKLPLSGEPTIIASSIYDRSVLTPIGDCSVFGGGSSLVFPLANVGDAEVDSATISLTADSWA